MKDKKDLILKTQQRVINEQRRLIAMLESQIEEPFKKLKLEDLEKRLERYREIYKETKIGA